MNGNNKRRFSTRVANRTDILPATSTGVVNAVLAIILVLTTLGICITRLGTTVGLVVGLVSGGALAAAACGTFLLLANIRHLLEESREIGAEPTRQGEGNGKPFLPSPCSVTRALMAAPIRLSAQAGRKERRSGPDARTPKR